MRLYRRGTVPIRERAVSAALDGTSAVRMGQWKYIPARGGGGYGSKGGVQPIPPMIIG